MKPWEWLRSTSVDEPRLRSTAKCVFDSWETCKRNSFMTSLRVSRGERGPTCMPACCTADRTTTRSNLCSKRLHAPCELPAGGSHAWRNSFPARKVCCDDRDRRLRSGESGIRKEGTGLPGADRRDHFGSRDGRACRQGDCSGSGTLRCDRN